MSGWPLAWVETCVETWGPCGKQGVRGMGVEIAIRHEVADGEQDPVRFRLLGGFRMTVAGAVRVTRP